MAENIREEIRRLHRRKQLTFSTNAIERMQDSESSGSEMGPDSPRRPDTPPTIKNPEMALFTFKQVWFSIECFSLFMHPNLSMLIVSGANDLRTHVEGKGRIIERTVRCGA